VGTRLLFVLAAEGHVIRGTTAWLLGEQAVPLVAARRACRRAFRAQLLLFNWPALM